MEANEIRILQLFPDGLLKDLQPVNNQFYSVGIHPGRIDDYYAQLVERIRFFASHPFVIAIGEAGLDKLCSTDFDLQKAVFIEIALLAEQVQKPLIIHCVRAWQDIIELHKSLQPSVPWMIHGFRGKPPLAQSLLLHGFYLSYGDQFNSESARITPLEYLCIETDEAAVPIDSVYQKIAFAKQVSSQLIQEKANGLFRNLTKAYLVPFIDAHTHLSSAT